MDVRSLAAAVRCSLGELQALLLKASVGGGLPVGLAEEVALAGRWLLANGLDGLGCALDSIESGPCWPQAPLMEGDEAVFEDARIAVCGSAALDLLLADICTRVTLRSPDSPLLFIGLAGVAAEAGSRIVVESAGVMLAAFSEGQVCFVDDVPAFAGDVSAVCSDTPECDWRRAAPAVEGVDAASERLERLERLASRTYVAANSASRESGAGAGSIDNE